MSKPTHPALDALREQVACWHDPDDPSPALQRARNAIPALEALLAERDALRAAVNQAAAALEQNATFPADVALARAALAKAKGEA